MARGDRGLKEGPGATSQAGQVGTGVGVSKPYLTKSTQQLDLERFQEQERKRAEGNTADPNEVNAPYATEDTDTEHYVGVSSEYMTHADVRNQPFAADGGAEEVLEAKLKEPFTLSGPGVVKENLRTTGHGSPQTIYAATSGEGFSPEEADHEAVDEEQGKLVSARREATDKGEPAPQPTDADGVDLSGPSLGTETQS